LAMGIVDLFQHKGLRIWGPNKKAAQFEASKAFSQSFMQKHGIPTARSGVFTSALPALEFAGTLKGRCAVKADGLALGKGVMICQTMAEAEAAIDEVLVKKSFGAAGNQLVIQEFLEGTEVSLHALCDGKTAKLFPTSQDHKRIFENDEGPNTGGMGTYSPAPFVTPTELERIENEIMQPWLKGCAAEKIDYRGVLYPGVMMTQDGPKVLEFNARFGDPETQVYLPLLESELLGLLEGSLEGSLGRTEIRWSKAAAVCVVLASEGYPASSRKGIPIEGIERANAIPGIKVFHAGTTAREGKVVTNGGRVLGVTAVANSLAEARDLAYKGVSEIRFEGAQFRRDIAAKALR
jgi:phosphoribosylamine---glycine ligase